MKETLAERLRSGDGSILKVYGSKTFLSVSPILDIGMFKVEVIPIKGKGNGNVVCYYMPVEAMVQLAEDIESGAFAARVSETTGKGKGYYSYVGGADGSRQLTFSLGNIGILCQISNKNGDKWEKQTIALSATNGTSPLRELARLVRLFTGVWTPTEGSYYTGILKAYQDGADKRAAMHVPDDAGYAAAQAEGFVPAGKEDVPFEAKAAGGSWI